MSLQPVRLLVNARDVIDVLAERGPLNPAEIAHMTGIPRSSVYRLLDGLTTIGWTCEASDGRASLNQRWLHLADSARSGMTEWASASKVLATFAERTGRTTFLTVQRGVKAFCIDWAVGQGIEILMLKPGRSLPLFCGAAGRVFLAYSSDEDREQYLAQAPFPMMTTRTLTTANQLRADALETRRQGHVLSDEDVTGGIGALGVAVISQTKGVVAAVSVGSLIQDILEHREELVFELKEAAASLASSYDSWLVANSAESISPTQKRSSKE